MILDFAVAEPFGEQAARDTAKSSAAGTPQNTQPVPKEAAHKEPSWQAMHIAALRLITQALCFQVYPPYLPWAKRSIASCPLNNLS